ncbi:MAG: hypothetical protein QG577_1394 [Thermodesulfobacteriota bacterium]|nr:hypothetical protein [Thermodesulfobacteriota bacterium]
MESEFEDQCLWATVGERWGTHLGFFEYSGVFFAGPHFPSDTVQGNHEH